MSGSTERVDRKGVDPHDVKVGDWLWVPGSNATLRVSRLPNLTHGGWDVGRHLLYVDDHIWRRFVRVQPPERALHA